MTHTACPRRLLPALRFRASETASLSVEAVLAIPFMIWVVLGLFTLTDAFVTLHSNVLSTYSVSDILSRQTGAIDADDIEGLNALHRIVSRADADTGMRVTMVMFDDNDNGYRVQWSYATVGQVAISDGSFAEVQPRVPELTDGEGVLLVETWTQVRPLVTYLVQPFEIYQAVATRPRFAPTLAWAG